MKKIVCRFSTLLLLGWCASAASAEQSNDAKAACRQEAKQVVVWPPGPKAAPRTRVEEQVVKVCQAKVS